MENHHFQGIYHCLGSVPQLIQTFISSKIKLSNFTSTICLGSCLNTVKVDNETFRKMHRNYQPTVNTLKPPEKISKSNFSGGSRLDRLGVSASIVLVLEHRALESSPSWPQPRAKLASWEVRRKKYRETYMGMLNLCFSKILLPESWDVSSVHKYKQEKHIHKRLTLLEFSKSVWGDRQAWRQMYTYREQDYVRVRILDEHRWTSSHMSQNSGINTNLSCIWRATMAFAGQEEGPLMLVHQPAPLKQIRAWCIKHCNHFGAICPVQVVAKVK